MFDNFLVYENVGTMIHIIIQVYLLYINVHKVIFGFEVALVLFM